MSEITPTAEARELALARSLLTEAVGAEARRVAEARVTRAREAAEAAFLAARESYGWAGCLAKTRAKYAALELERGLTRKAVYA